MITLADDERKLLYKCHRTIDQVVAEPEYGIRALSQSRASGGGHGFDYEVTRSSLKGQWSNVTVISRMKDGSPGRLHFDEPHLRIEITLTRLLKWSESLPDELRERAGIAWATKTRDLGALWAIVREAIDLSAPAEQLGLFPEMGVAS